jgi:tRNA1(Val) A37 N6-methylase TrmN6
MNPPFNDAARHRASTDPKRQAAHVAEPETLDIFLRAARRMLKPSGTLTLIWRADGLAKVLQGLSRGFGSVAVQPIHPRDGENAIRILVGAIKGARGPLLVRPALVLNDDQGKPTREADSILRGDAAISLLGGG